MDWSFVIFNSILLGVGLAMDAFSVSVANSLAEPGMSGKRAATIAGVFGGFQTLMPLLGWFLVRTLVRYLEAFSRWIPWIALVLLVYLGVKMLLEARRERLNLEEEEKELQRDKAFGVVLLIQGIATSIDALSVGFTISEYDWLAALVAALIIGAETFGICMAGCKLGKVLADKFAGYAKVLGGCILIFIGIEIFVKGVF